MPGSDAADERPRLTIEHVKEFFRRLSPPDIEDATVIGGQAAAFWAAYYQVAVILTTNLPFSEWTQVIPNARLCKALIDRITDQAHIVETGTESYRFRRTLEKRRSRSPLANTTTAPPPLAARKKETNRPTEDASLSERNNQAD